ncbi:MAG: nucleoside deaminase [Candidatus Gastranaerophilales bacterium]|nr:nucleoside deaminase [Candidatus Gastranaerophilales bacterium]
MNLEFMKKAVEKAEESGNDIPVGAIIVKDGKIIAAACNEREKRNITTGHAEIIAVEKACKKLNNWRLNECELYVTLEPCPMCAGAIIQARISKVYFGAADMLNGAFGSKSDMRKIMNYDIPVIGGIMEEECSSLLKKFFEARR